MESASPATQSEQSAQPEQRGCGCLIAALVIAAPFVVLAVFEFGGPWIWNKVKHDQARALGMSVANSITGYHAEYSKYPLPQDGNISEASPLRTDEMLTGTLLGLNIEQNPKKINFLPDLKSVERGGGFGLVTEGEAAMIVDPWGEEYYVLMDANYDDSIENPNSNSTATTLRQGVLVFSGGPDKDPSTWEDNVMNWDSGKSKNSFFLTPQIKPSTQ